MASKMDRHVESLASKRATLKHEIDEELERPMPDHLKVHELKRRRVFLKDEIVQAQAS